MDNKNIVIVCSDKVRIKTNKKYFISCKMFNAYERWQNIHNHDHVYELPYSSILINFFINMKKDLYSIDKKHIVHIQDRKIFNEINECLEFLMETHEFDFILDIYEKSDIYYLLLHYNDYYCFDDACDVSWVTDKTEIDKLYYQYLLDHYYDNYEDYKKNYNENVKDELYKEFLEYRNYKLQSIIRNAIEDYIDIREKHESNGKIIRSKTSSNTIETIKYKEYDTDNITYKDRQVSIKKKFPFIHII